MRGYKLAIIVVVALIVGGGIGFVSTGFATAGIMEYDHSANYDPSSPDAIEDLYINTDIGKVVIQYNTSATTHYANYDVEIKISGLFMEGKVYTDFFRPSSEWLNAETGDFRLETIPGLWIDPAQWFKSYNINITITLRTDVIYDLHILTATGSIEMDVPDNVVLNRTSILASTGSVEFSSSGVEFLGDFSTASSTGSVEVYADNTNFTKGFSAETSTGSLTLNFTNCIMGDNLLGDVSTGSITFKSYNMIYTQDINLNLHTSTGSIHAEIYQYTNMNANITALFETSTGSIDVLYRDNLANIGVRFSSSVSTGSINYVSHSTMEILGSVYQSLNYGTSAEKYTFSLHTSTGGVDVDGQSANP